MISIDIHNIQRVTSETIDVTHVGLVGVLRLYTDRGEATLFVSPAQAEALAEAWHRVTDPAASDDAAVALSRQLEAEDAARDDTFAELEEMTAQPKEAIDA